MAVLEIAERRLVPAPPEAVWPDVADGARFAEWYAFCDTVQEPEPGVRVLIGSWGSQRSAVPTAITARDAPRRFAWRHTAEELDGRPAPSMAIETTVEVLLEAVDGGTEVTITSRQEAAGALQGAAIRLLGKRKTRNMLQQSLTLLAARHGS